MKSEHEIRQRIDELTSEMYKIKESKHTDLFTHIGEIKRSVSNYKELKHIYWMLDEPLPEFIESLRSY